MDSLDRKIEELHYIVRKGIEDGLTNEEIEQKLESYKLEPYYRQQLIQNIQNEKWDRKQFWKTLFSGIALLAGGLGYTLFTYYNNLGESYLIFWGLMVSGIILIVRAFLYYRK